jgi:hypothetical protein
MVKSRKQMHKKRKVRRVRRVMRGGDFSEEQKSILQNTGFYPGQIERFELMGLTFDQVNQKVQEITGDDFHGNSDDLADAVEQALDEEHMNQGMPHNNNNMDMDIEDGQMDMHELDIDSDYNATDNEAGSDDEMNGGRKKRRTIKKRKGRKTRKTVRKTVRKTGRKSRKQRGGMCYGNGVGANNYDPNFSIYNTRELTLFPYNPTN